MAVVTVLAWFLAPGLPGGRGPAAVVRLLLLLVLWLLLSSVMSLLLWLWFSCKSPAMYTRRRVSHFATATGSMPAAVAAAPPVFVAIPGAFSVMVMTAVAAAAALLSVSTRAGRYGGRPRVRVR